MISIRSLGMLAIRSVAARRVSVLSLHTSASVLRARSGGSQSLQQLLDRKPFKRNLKPQGKATPVKQYSLVEAHVALSDEISTWITLRSTTIHLKTLGIPEKYVETWLEKFPSVVREEISAISPEEPQSEDALWPLNHIATMLGEDQKFAIQSAFMTRFIPFAIAQLEALPSPTSAELELLTSLRDIRTATDLRKLTEWYPLSRSMRRKIIMHVGPTNSGKTYNALQALAAAPSGVYAGPLRLLAHEVWQRINKGSITPKKSSPLDEKEPGIVDLDDAAPLAITTETSPDASGVIKTIATAPSPPVAYQGRACNLVTGEEQRIVSPTATIIACTVEMIPKHLMWDVGVVDEIQMIADPNRGGAWASAVLGLAARELHLCGEDTVVDLVRALCAITGDELVVNRYERLTPLEVAPKSLRGNLKYIEPGDCVVTFSRAEIFDTKRRIEQATGLRCAVVYGRLPPEIRSEQAQLFNDEKSSYDVIVASDSVGMGLNLKIRRVVFMRTEKRVGKQVWALPIPLIKQIGGRAGRFGVHKSTSQHREITKASIADIAASQPPGIVTALDERSLKRVQEAMAAQNPTIKQARVDISNPNISLLARALPPKSGVTDLLEIMRLLARLPPTMRLAAPPFGTTRDVNAERPVVTSESDAQQLPRLQDMGSEIDAITVTLPLQERLTFAIAPGRWRDPFAKAAALVYFRVYEHQLHVRVQKDIEGLGLIEALDHVRTLRRKYPKFVRPSASDITSTPEFPGNAAQAQAAASKPLVPFIPRMTPEEVDELEEDTLQRLESLHSTLTLYLWLSYRLPLGFYQADEAERLKAEVERAIEWCLKQIKSRSMKRLPNRVPSPPMSAEERTLSYQQYQEGKIKYLTRDAMDRWRSKGATAAAWDQLVGNKPKQVTA